ncbi:MAG: patatin-like phospholipase family protein [Christensenellaceae bacterium]
MKIFDFIVKLFKREKKVKRVGLALGSGGAKGFALIGAMQAFEENGVKFDMIAGTSIGSIVGGMTACGYSSREIFNFITHYNITDMKTLIMMKFKRVTVEGFLNEVLGGVSFEDTKTPFYAIACDLESGSEVVLESGSLAKALACSSAIPPVFKAVDYNGLKLIDGAFVNSVPANVLKERGCDVVISVTLTARENNMSDVSTVNALYKNNNLKRVDRLTKGIEASDVYIEPDLSGFSSASVSGFQRMFEIGYEETMKRMPEILDAINGGKSCGKDKKKKYTKR